MAFSLASVFRRDRPVVPVVRLSGAIGGAGGLRPGLSLAGVETALAKAFGIEPRA